MKIINSCLLLILFFGCNPKKNESILEKSPKIKSGVVEYNISVEPKNVELFDAGDFGTRARGVFNDGKLHFVKLGKKDQESFQIIDLKTNKETNYLVFRGEKYALENSDEMIPEMGELIFQDEKKIIAGYECQKAIAKMGDGFLIAWMTLELGVNFCPYVISKGFALEYSLNMPFGKVNYLATKVELKQIEEKLFQPSKEFKSITLNELQTKIMGRSAESAFEKGTVLTTFGFENMAGQKVGLESFKGTVVLINFWFINCPPCQMEIPDLNELRAEYEGRNVAFLAITFDVKSKVKSFLQESPFNFQHFPNARSIIELYGIQVFPTSVVINKEGKVVNSKIGGSMNIKEELKVFIEEALAQN
ncbi:redoxin domain-containing protein [Saprospiraceae bacterium]|nr:redoxin domain-containing protein [bacterium]MDB4539365.1 redoxin domain-containing protein [Saprospiraceae bacterium]MDC3210542.1 redoxin domain-containing protein [Saprospiraceae bacterium]